MRSHERAESNAKISISLSKEMLSALDAMAEQEGRSRSNMLQRILTGQLIERRQTFGGDRAAESPGDPYKTK